MHYINLPDLFHDSEGDLALEEDGLVELLGFVDAENGGVDCGEAGLSFFGVLDDTVGVNCYVGLGKEYQGFR